MQKLLKCEAGRLGQRDLMIYLKKGGSASALRQGCRIAITKLDNVLQNQISVIDLYNCRIKLKKIRNADSQQKSPKP
jgi:hypothetical protein